jgi:hypothetical protein
LGLQSKQRASSCHDQFGQDYSNPTTQYIEYFVQNTLYDFFCRNQFGNAGQNQLGNFPNPEWEKAKKALEAVQKEMKKSGDDKTKSASPEKQSEDHTSDQNTNNMNNMGPQGMFQNQQQFNMYQQQYGFQGYAYYSQYGLLATTCATCFSGLYYFYMFIILGA